MNEPMTIKFAFTVSLLSTQQQGENAKTGWLRIRIMFQSGTISLPMDCCFSELARSKST